ISHYEILTTILLFRYFFHTLYYRALLLLTATATVVKMQDKAQYECRLGGVTEAIAEMPQAKRIRTTLW
ncbi:MAG TPA: hypothetical protein PKZ70_06495, partial [Candidatus Atribacteria bacterium]|nr:hypothetical protein [Candidatus Atribacteria bacterium]